MEAAVISQTNKMKDKIDSLWQIVGNTPMIEISYCYKDGKEQTILVKCEQQRSLTGSVKDRMALYILKKAYETGTIQSGMQIVEATSGNTGISFAAIGKALGHDVKIIMPDWLSKERMEIIKSYGAQLELVSHAEGGFKGCIQRAEMLQHNERVFLPRQFENKYNVEAHEKTTGKEILNHLLLYKLEPHAFIAGVGTGGTVMGVGRQLRMIYPNVKIHPLEPAESQTLATGSKKGTHRIQGISDEFIPAILDLKKLDEIVHVNDGDAILMAQKIAKDLGIGVGISSGANLLGAIKIQQENNLNKAIITLFPDSNKKYLSTALAEIEPAREGYLSLDIKLISYKPVNSSI